MKHKSKDIAPHVEDMVAAVQHVLREKGLEGLRVMRIVLETVPDNRCPPGFHWDCRDIPPGGHECGCFPDA